MAGCTHDGNTIPVMAPKDAEGRDVPLDTKVMYDDDGVKYGVCGLIFRSMTEICDAGWTVELVTDENKVRQISLDYMYLEKRDSWEALEKDLNRVASCGENSTPVCAYTWQPCAVCKFHSSENCTSAMCADIVSRIRKLRSEDR